jgi:hypothetical protein
MARGCIENVGEGCCSEGWKRTREDGYKKSNMEALSARKPRIAPALRETLAGSTGSGRPASRNSRLGQYCHRNAGARLPKRAPIHLRANTHTVLAISTTIANTTTLDSH